MFNLIPKAVSVDTVPTSSARFRARPTADVPVAGAAMATRVFSWPQKAQDGLRFRNILEGPG